MLRFILPVVLAALLNVGTALAQDYYLAWDPPLTDTTGAALQEGEIGKYWVYVTNKNDAFTEADRVVEIVSAAFGVQNPPSYIKLSLIPGLTPGKKVAVTAEGTMLAESGFSNSLTNVKPNNPTSTRVVKGQP